jgi:hypothetical protein
MQISSFMPRKFGQTATSNHFQIFEIPRGAGRVNDEDLGSVGHLQNSTGCRCPKVHVASKSSTFSLSLWRIHYHSKCVCGRYQLESFTHISCQWKTSISLNRHDKYVSIIKTLPSRCKCPSRCFFLTVKSEKSNLKGSGLRFMFPICIECVNFIRILINIPPWFAAKKSKNCSKTHGLIMFRTFNKAKVIFITSGHVCVNFRVLIMKRACSD